MVCQTTPSSPTAQPSLASANWTACREASSKWRSAARAQGARAAPTASAARKGRIDSPLVPDRQGVDGGWWVVDGEAEQSVFTIHHPPSTIHRLSIEQPVAHDAVERLQRVFQADFLALFVRSARIAHRNLVNAPRGAALLGDLRGDLRLEAEAVRLELNALQHLAAENLVAGLHVRQVQVREHVRQRRQHLVGDVVPEVQDAVTLADEARAVHHVGAVLNNWLD